MYELYNIQSSHYTNCAIRLFTAEKLIPLNFMLVGPCIIVIIEE